MFPILCSQASSQGVCSTSTSRRHRGSGRKHPPLKIGHLAGSAMGRPSLCFLHSLSLPSPFPPASWEAERKTKSGHVLMHKPSFLTVCISFDEDETGRNGAAGERLQLYQATLARESTSHRVQHQWPPGGQQTRAAWGSKEATPRRGRKQPGPPSQTLSSCNLGCSCWKGDDGCHPFLFLHCPSHHPIPFFISREGRSLG